MKIKIRVSGVIVKEKKILLLKRKNGRFPLHWELPGGVVRTAGIPLSEFLEGRVNHLTGMDFKVRQKMWFYESFDNDDHVLTHVYLGEAKGDIRRDDKEIKEFKWFTSDEVENLDMVFSDWEIIEDLSQEGIIL